MDEQREWLKAKRKERLRIMAVLLCFCLLITTYPNILETLSVLAGGMRGEKDSLCISGFAVLPEEICNQTVPVGTTVSELILPDTLEAFVIKEENSGKEEEESPGEGEEGKPGEGGETGGEEKPGEGEEESPGEGGEGPDEGEGGGNPGEGEGGENPGEGENGGNSGEGENGGNPGEGEDGGNSGEGENGGNSGEEEDGGNSGEGENGGNSGEGEDGENPGGGEDGSESSGDGNDGGSGEDGESAGGDGSGGAQEEDGKEDDLVLHVRSGFFALPEYGAEQVVTVEQMEEEPEAEDEGAPETETDAPAKKTKEAVVIEGIYWQSAPIYDSDVINTYIFTPILPKGYDLAEGVSLPEIAVTVVEDDTQAKELHALIELLRALPDPEEYLSYDEGADRILEHKDMIDEARLEEARQAADDYLDRYPDTDMDVVSEGDAGDEESGPVSLAAFLTRLKGWEHIRDTKTDCMDLECLYHYPWFVQRRMEQDEVPELLTLEDLVEDYGVEAPQIPKAQTYGGRAFSARAYSAARAAAPQTLMVTADNENNAHTGEADGDIDNYIGRYNGGHPIEVSFTLDQLPTQSAYLAVKAYDVDEDFGETDYVYLNDDIFSGGDNHIGYLAGTDNTWNTTVLEVPLEKLVQGKNVISITVAGSWSVEIDWMQLILDGGAADSNMEEFSLKLRGSSIEDENVTVYSDVVIKQKGTTQYATEYTLTQNATGNALDACFGKASASEEVALTMPLNSPSGSYTIVGILKNPSTEEIKAVDRLTFYFIQNVGIGPAVSHTLNPDTLTRQNVTIQISVQDVPDMEIMEVSVSPASKTVSTNGTYTFTVNYKEKGIAKSFSYPVKVGNIDKKAPVITYNPITVMEEQPKAEIEQLFLAALSATDDRMLASDPFTYTIPAGISNTPGTKTVTVTAVDFVGNKATKSCQIIVTPDPIKLTMGEGKEVSGSKDKYTLKAVLKRTGGGTITETGFVWGVVANPTMELKVGSVKTASVVKTKGAALSANATGLISGVEYYGRAYAKVTADGKESIAYSDSKKFGMGIPNYGTFSVSKVSGSTFTITRTGGSEGKQTVYYRTVNGSAIGGTHFTHLASSVTFEEGETSKTVTVSEKGVTTAYSGKKATSYSNADRTYSFEIYRVDGGGEINQDSRLKTRTMTKSSSYTVDRTVYTKEKSKTEVADTTKKNGKRVADTTGNQGGTQTNVSFLTNRYDEINYHTNSSFSTYYTNVNQKTYLKETAGGWYYRYVLKAYEDEDGYEYAYFGKKALQDKHYNLDGDKKGAAISGLSGQLWMCSFLQGRWDSEGTYYFPHTGTGGGENSLRPYNSSGTTVSYNNRTYVNLGFNDTCYLYFGATGADSDVWYVDGLTGYALVYDKTEPKCIGAAPMAGGTYLPGDPITVALVFDEIVDKTNSSNLEKVSINTNVGTLTYAGGADTNVLYFTGNVSASASLNGSSALEVTGITNSGSIKDMCNLAGTESTFTSSNTNVIVDATKPSVTITAKTSGNLPRHQALVTATGAASIQYVWTKNTDLPAYGWQPVTSGTTLTQSQDSGTTGGKATWYLHVLATASTGASTHEYKAFTFMQPAITAVSVRAGSSSTSAEVSDVWKPYKFIVVKYAGTQTNGATLTIDGPQTSSQTITATSGTKYLKVTKNGIYTITITDSYGNVVTESVEVKKIDTESPSVTVKSGSSTASDVTHNALSIAVFPADTGGSGVAKVEYAWTNTTTKPATSDWKELSPGADGSYQTTYTATETEKTAKYLHVRVTDGAGNVSTTVRLGPYQVIAKAAGAALPTMTITGNPTAWAKSAALKWTAKAGTGTGAGTISEVHVPDSDMPKTVTTGTSTVTKNGNYMFTAVDSNGNTVTKDVLVTKIDNEAPKLDKITATGGKTGKITLTGVTDACSVVLDAKGNYSKMDGSGVKTRQYQFAGTSSWTSFTGSSFNVDKNGVYTVKLTDNLGNYSEYSVEMTDIDATAPEVTCTVNATPSAKSGWYTGATVPVILTFADKAGDEGGTPSGISLVQYKWVTDQTVKPTSGLIGASASAIADGTVTCNLSSGSQGTYYLYYKVTDKKGNVTDGFSEQIRKDSYAGSATITGPTVGQPLSAGLKMHIKFWYGPAGGRLMAGTATASAQELAVMEAHAGTGTKTVEKDYTAKVSGSNRFYYYRYAVNGEKGTSSYSSWSYYVRQIDFNSQGGSDVESQLVWDKNTTAVCCTIAKPADPVRTGYTFGGWYTDAACTAGNEFDFTTQVRANTTLYAKWTANVYQVTYHLVNSDGSAYTPDAEARTYTYGQGLALPVPESAREGFTFSGWYDNAQYTGTTYTTVEKTATGDKEYYAYFKDTQAPVYMDLSYVNAQEGMDGWLRGSDAANLVPGVTVNGCSDNEGIERVSVRVDEGNDETAGISAYVPVNGYLYPLSEGEHTYQFTLADQAGNETVSKKAAFKYDGTKPVIGEITCEKKKAGFLDWIIGQESLIIHIPVSDETSGVYRLTYTETKITEAGETTEEKTVTLSGRAGEQTVDLKLDADWKGRISHIICIDKAGNISDGKTVGTSGGVIVEDNAPSIAITEADMTDVSDPRPGNAVSEDYYEQDAVPVLYVAVQDEDADGMGISAGIEKITYTINGAAAKEVSGNFDAALTGRYGFTISLDGYAGVVSVAVHAVDHAGNSAVRSVAVKIKGKEQTPEARPDYPKDAIGNLSPNTVYEIRVPAGDGGTPYLCTTDENGLIPFVLTEGENTVDLCGRTIDIKKKGDGHNTSDSEVQTLTITARPPAIPKDKVETEPEIVKDADDAVIKLKIADPENKKKEYSTDGGQTWQDVPEDNTIKELAPGDVIIRVKADEETPHGEETTITITPSMITITAVFALNYEGADSAGAPAAQTGLTYKSALQKPGNPAREGYDFVAWYKEASCETPWRFVDEGDAEKNMIGDIFDKTGNYKDKYTVTDEVITVTLYAGWRENTAPKLSVVLTDGHDEKEEDKWHNTLCVDLTYSDNVGVSKLYVKKDNGVYEELDVSRAAENGTDSDGYAQYRLTFDGLEEGKHTYSFRAVDAAGNETAAKKVTAKLDTVKPELGEASFNEGYKNLWHWIIRKDSLLITIPVTEEGSGMGTVEYILLPADGVSDGAVKYANLTEVPDSDSPADYKAQISVAPDFKGKIVITAKDQAGNVSSTKTIGADGSGIEGVIVEDNAPVIAILADRETEDESAAQTTGIAVSDKYYNTAPKLFIEVEDEAETEGDGVDGSVVTSGLASVSWKINDGPWNPAGADFETDIKTAYRFTVNDLEGQTGTFVVTIKAADQAGNEAQASVTVRIKAREPEPNPKVDYGQEKLTGLIPNGKYGVGEEIVIADEQGRIAIREEWFGTNLQIDTKGGDNTLDSEEVQITLAQRPAAPGVSKESDETIKGKKDGAIAGADTAMEYSADNGKTWTAVQDDHLAEGSLKDVSAGEIQIRVKATQTAPHGEAVTVEIGAGRTLAVTFAENGGSSTLGVTGKNWHDTVAAPRQPERKGYAFAGWYQEEAFTNRWRFADEAEADLLEDDLTLYAKWEDVTDPSLDARLMNGSRDVTEDGNWYNSLFVNLVYADNAEVTKLYVKKEEGPYMLMAGNGTENGTDENGNTKYQILYNDLEEGEHTYFFKAADAEDNAAEKKLTVKFDTKKPAFGEAAFNEGYKNIWNWIIRKDSLLITIPVAEEGSGIDTVTYTLTTEGGAVLTENAKVEKNYDGGADADYKAVISIAPDFKGKVTVFAEDKAGNAADTLTIGTDGGGIQGVIIENRAPEINFSTDGGRIAENYYDNAPDIAVDITDDKDEQDESAVTGGIASVTYQVGGGVQKTVNHDYTGSLVTSDRFTIPAAEIPTGVTEIMVTVMDNAGNQAVQKTTVKVKSVEETPDVTIGYVAEKLTGFIADAVYVVGGVGITAGADGTIEIKEEWINGKLAIVKLGDDYATIDSKDQELIVPARPKAPYAGTKKTSYPNAEDGALTGLDEKAVYEISGNGGETWTEAVTKGGELAGLKAGTYWIRVKAVEGASFKSDVTEAVIEAVPATPYETPNAQIDYRNETLTGLTPGAVYIVEYSGTEEGDEEEDKEGDNEVSFTADEKGTIPIQEKWFDKVLSVVRKGNEKERSDSGAQSLLVPARTEAPKPAAVGESGVNKKDGKLTGLTANTAYDISTDGGKTWESKTADAKGEITGLAPADYVVRCGASDDRFASRASGPVLVDSYKLKVIFKANGAVYQTVLAAYGKDVEEIPSIPPKKDAGGQLFVGEWCDDKGNPADFTNITKDMTVYAVYTAAYTVTLQGGEGYTLSASSGSKNPVKTGGSFGFRFVLEKGYQKTGSFAVKVGGVTVTLAEDGTYTITGISENKTVTVEGVRKQSSSGGSHKEPEDTTEKGDTLPAEDGEKPAGSKSTGGPDEDTKEDAKKDTKQDIQDIKEDSRSMAEGTVPMRKGTDTTPVEDSKEPGGGEYANDTDAVDGAENRISGESNDGQPVISTDQFSDDAAAYERMDSGENGRTCGLCHICPTFLGICCFIWLAVITAVVVIMILLLGRNKEDKEKK